MSFRLFGERLSKVPRPPAGDAAGNDEPWAAEVFLAPAPILPQGKRVVDIEPLRPLTKLKERMRGWKNLVSQVEKIPGVARVTDFEIVSDRSDGLPDGNPPTMTVWLHDTPEEAEELGTYGDHVLQFIYDARRDTFFVNRGLHETLGPLVPANRDGSEKEEVAYDMLEEFLRREIAV